MNNGKARCRLIMKKHTDKNVLCLHAQNIEEMIPDEVLMKHAKARWWFGTVHGSDPAGRNSKENIFLLLTYICPGQILNVGCLTLDINKILTNACNLLVAVCKKKKKILYAFKEKSK